MEAHSGISQETLNAAEQIDVSRYEGHTPWPWSRSSGWEPSPSVVDTENIYGSPPSGVVAKVVRASQDGKYSSDKDANTSLITNSPLIPALVHQRDQARAERDAERQRKDDAIRAAELYLEGIRRSLEDRCRNYDEEADALLARAKGESNG